uniref:Uncharacterized protein n=1 Tax=Cynoglossus semilaevis TaxID=244447 RepID=A0A3P8WUF8_CYNSE
MTLVWPLSSVTAPVDNQVALELENLATELTGFNFPWSLVLTLGGSSNSTQASAERAFPQSHVCLHLHLLYDQQLPQAESSWYGGPELKHLGTAENQFPSH